MKLTNLNPKFYDFGGDGVSDALGNPIPHRRGIGVLFDCPCGCGERVGLHFRTALDGKPKPESISGAAWDREGDTFETLTLRPSIMRMGPCRWHGYLTNGEFSSC